MYVVSLFAIVLILGLGAANKLTIDDHYKHRGKSTFIRGGLVGRCCFHMWLSVLQDLNAQPNKQSHAIIKCSICSSWYRRYHLHVCGDCNGGNGYI